MLKTNQNQQGGLSDMGVPEDSVTRDQTLTENVRHEKKRSE